MTTDNTPRSWMTARTHRSSSDAFRDHCEYACAVQRSRNKIAWFDVGCWVASGFLFGFTLTAIYRPAWFDLFGQLAKL